MNSIAPKNLGTRRGYRPVVFVALLLAVVLPAATGAFTAAPVTGATMPIYVLSNRGQ